MIFWFSFSIFIFCISHFVTSATYETWLATWGQAALNPKLMDAIDLNSLMTSIRWIQLATYFKQPDILNGISTPTDVLLFESDNCEIQSYKKLIQVGSQDIEDFN